MNTNKLLIINHNNNLLENIKDILKDMDVSCVYEDDYSFDDGKQYNNVIILPEDIDDVDEKKSYISNRIRKTVKQLKTSGNCDIMVIENRFDNNSRFYYLTQSIDYYLTIDKIDRSNLITILQKFVNVNIAKENRQKELQVKLVSINESKTRLLLQQAVARMKEYGLKGVFAVYKDKQGFLINLGLNDEQYAIYDGLMQFYPKILKYKVKNRIISCEQLNNLCYDYFDDLYEAINVFQLQLIEDKGIEIIYFEYGDFEEKYAFNFLRRYLDKFKEISNILFKAMYILSND